jgi:hypothetical protein
LNHPAVAWAGFSDNDKDPFQTWAGAFLREDAKIARILFTMAAFWKISESARDPIFWSS